MLKKFNLILITAMFGSFVSLAFGQASPTPRPTIECVCVFVCKNSKDTYSQDFSCMETSNGLNGKRRRMVLHPTDPYKETDIEYFSDEDWNRYGYCGEQGGLSLAECTPFNKASEDLNKKLGITDAD